MSAGECRDKWDKEHTKASSNPTGAQKYHTNDIKQLRKEWVLGCKRAEAKAKHIQESNMPDTPDEDLPIIQPQTPVGNSSIDGATGNTPNHRTPTLESPFGLGMSLNILRRQDGSPVLGEKTESDGDEDFISFTPEPELKNIKKIKNGPESPNTERHSQNGVGGESPLAIKSE